MVLYAGGKEVDRAGENSDKQPPSFVGFIRRARECRGAPWRNVKDMSKGGGGGGRSSDGQTSDAMNPNNPDYQPSQDKTSKQGIPNNDA